MTGGNEEAFGLALMEVIGRLRRRADGSGLTVKVEERLTL